MSSVKIDTAETGIRTCVLTSSVQAQAASNPTPYPLGHGSSLQVGSVVTVVELHSVVDEIQYIFAFK